MNHIVIIGFMGSGKTRVGKRLAKDFDIPFVDIDRVVTKKMNLSSKEIFDRFGEPFYRALETTAVKALIEDPEQKVISLLEQVGTYAGRMELQIVPFTHIQEEIRRSCPEDHFTLIMRRFMMRLADMLARELRCRALVTGENLGQVASQTMQALAVSEDVATMPVLRPLIGLDKEEIVKIARKIGTFDTSILPYEDCCTVFTPRHPATRPRLEDVRQAEAALDVESLVQKALADETWVRVKSTDPARI